MVLYMDSILRRRSLFLEYVDTNGSMVDGLRCKQGRHGKRGRRHHHPPDTFKPTSDCVSCHLDSKRYDRCR